MMTVLSAEDLKNSANWKVLVVDDEIDNVEVVAETLMFREITVAMAYDGAQAIKSLETFPANLILMDLSMPRMNGWDALAKIKASETLKHIPVVALSAHALLGDKEKALEAGFDGYITKPISVVHLIRDIISAIDEGRTYHQALR